MSWTWIHPIGKATAGKLYIHRVGLSLEEGWVEDKAEIKQIREQTSYKTSISPLIYGSQLVTEGDIMPTITWEKVGEIAYEAYGESAHWKNFLGDAMPKWGDLPQEIKNHWAAASQAAFDYVNHIIIEGS